MLTKRHVAEHIAKKVGAVLAEHGYSREVIKIFRLTPPREQSVVGVKIDIKDAIITADRRAIFIEIPECNVRSIPMGIDVSNFRFETDPKTRVLRIDSW